MLRKLTSSALVFALSILGLTQANPAQAWPDSTTAVSTLTNADERWQIDAVGKTLTSNMVFAYSGANNESKYIRAYTLSPEGHLTEPVDIVRANDSTTQFLFEPSKSSWVDSAGNINIMYTKFDNSQPLRSATLIHVTSRDGITWSAPVVVVRITYRDNDPCALSQQGCGISSIVVTKTGSGQVALLYGVLNSDGSKQILFTTKLLGKAWVKPAAINTSNYVAYNLELVPAGKGFVASWIYAPGNGEPRRLMSAFSTAVTAKSWTAPQERRNIVNLVPLALIQTSPTKFAIVYTEPSAISSETFVSMQTFDTRTSRFGSAQQIVALPNTNLFFDIKKTEFRAGQSALSFGSYIQSGTDARYILFRNGSATYQWVNQELATPDGVTQYIQGVSMDDLGHLSIVWLNQPQFGDASLFLSQIYRGNRSDVELGQTVESYNVGFSQDGDVYISSFWNSTISGLVRIRSDAPTLTTYVSAAGTPKVGKVLSTKLPKIDPDLAGQKWLYSYQWYSCQFRVTEVLTIATENCSLISGATAASYKVKAADKGKFLQVKLSVKSDNATQVQFSASTLAVK
jgi:hypothetical protein